MQDYASGQLALINAVMSRMGNVSPGEGLQKFEIRGDNLVTINDRNKHIKARKAW